MVKDFISKENYFQFFFSLFLSSFYVLQQIEYYIFYVIIKKDIRTIKAIIYFFVILPMFSVTFFGVIYGISILTDCPFILRMLENGKFLNQKY
jgi:hypothetical protein